MARKEKLKKIAQKGAEDYSAKAEYIEKGGMMGKGEVFVNEEVTTGSGRSIVKHTTKDTETTRKGKPTAKYSTANDWLQFISGGTTTPGINDGHRGFKFHGKVYSISSGKGGGKTASWSATQV